MLQHFVSCVSSTTLTCCDICILMFHCDLANVAYVDFRCCIHVMLGVVSRREGRAPDVGCCTQHRSQYGRNMWGRGKKDARCSMLRVTSFATCSEHVRNTLATSFVECCKDDGSQHRKSSSQHLLRLARSTADNLPSSESCGPGPVR
jgi:hypothetical protein